METDWVLSSEVELGLVSHQQNQRYYCSFHLVGLKLWKIKQDQQLNQDIHITSKRQLLWVNVLYFPFVWTTSKLHTWVVFPHHRYWWAVILPTRLLCQNNNNRKFVFISHFFPLTHLQESKSKGADNTIIQYTQQMFLVACL